MHFITIKIWKKFRINFKIPSQPGEGNFYKTNQYRILLQLYFPVYNMECLGGLNGLKASPNINYLRYLSDESYNRKF